MSLCGSRFDITFACCSIIGQVTFMIISYMTSAFSMSELSINIIDSIRSADIVSENLESKFFTFLINCCVETRNLID